MKIKETLKAACVELFELAETMVDLSGPEKMDFVLDAIAKLDNASPLVIIPDGLEKLALRAIVQKLFDKNRE